MTAFAFFRDMSTVLTFNAGYNTSVVLVGTTLLGVAAGLVGAMVVLRKRALMSDSISHSTLPGVGAGFLVGLALFGDGRMIWGLMISAMGTAVLGVLSVQWIRDHTRLPEDAAIGTVLSVFYGVGIVLLSLIQALDTDGKAGLNGFLLGSAASLRLSEVWFIVVICVLVIVGTLGLRKEFALLCFDRDFAAADGWPVRLLDLLLMAFLLIVVAVGLKTVGMVLIIAIVIIPGVSARFWTDRVDWLLYISAGLGGLSAGLGVTASAVLPDLPTGAVIVLTAGLFFLISLLFGPARGLVATAGRLALWRFQIWECQMTEAVRQGRPQHGLVLRLLGLVDGAGRLTARGERAARRFLIQDHPFPTLSEGAGP